MPIIRSWSPSSSSESSKSDSSSSSSDSSTIEKAQYEAMNISRDELGGGSDSASTRSASSKSRGVGSETTRRRRNGAKGRPKDAPCGNKSYASSLGADSDGDSDNDGDDEKETAPRKAGGVERSFSVHDELEEMLLVEKLTARIVSTAQSIYTLSHPSTLAVLLSTFPDGTPVAQLVVRDGLRTLVLMEERGLLPRKTKGVQGREWFAVHGLLKQVEAFWGVLCKKGRGKLGWPYYVSGLTVKGDGKVV
ncbi:hypothetical protein BCR34DRAFT_598166 [Clohesyomyces aquaticus]|uniref:Uncharacterized protein n=1 Tax=Clohesyomyces aquaticus TaxID=1231657 RepID=A0A1Y2A0B3_9PLEO|nr:hypothetical protein BCR34DRAFT_598166 [Clohesyomyces aquaticus]